MIGNTWKCERVCTVGKYIFKASAANGIGNKLDHLTEVERVLPFFIAPPPQFDSLIYPNYGSCFYIYKYPRYIQATRLLLCYV